MIASRGSLSCQHMLEPIAVLAEIVQKRSCLDRIGEPEAFSEGDGDRLDPPEVIGERLGNAGCVRSVLAVTEVSHRKTSSHRRSGHKRDRNAGQWLKDDASTSRFHRTQCRPA